MKIERAIRKIKEFGLHHAIQDLPHSELTVKAFEMAISALEKQIELNDYLNTLRKNKKYQIYDILSEFALEVEDE